VPHVLCLWGYTCLQEYNAKHQLNLNYHCDDAKLRVTPAVGRAIVWYNHISEEDNWLPKMDRFSLHGSCPVKNGEKFIANFWIKFTANRDFDLQDTANLKSTVTMKTN
jgi:hypothetical protein